MCEEDWRFCSTDHPLLLISSIPIPHFYFCIVCFSHPISQTLQGPPEGRLTTQARENVGGGPRRYNCPDLSALGVVPPPAPAGHGSPDGGGLTGLPTLPIAPQGHGCPGSMLSTTMVGTLIRGWRNRSSPRRPESKLLHPQSQDGTQTQGMFDTLL